MALADTDESRPVRSVTDRYRDDWVMALRTDAVVFPGAEHPVDRLVLEHPGSVAVLAVDDTDRVLVLHQYRHPMRQRMVELPAGLRDVGGESLAETARRELAEEAGLTATHLERLLDVVPSPGISTETVRVYRATGVTPAASEPGFVAEHEEADMTTEWVTLAELVAAVLAGRIRHGVLAAAVLAEWARQQADTGQRRADA